MSTVDEATARPSARKPLIGAQVGLYVDMFDVYLPIIVLAPAAIYFEPDHLSATGSRILTAVVFAATLLGRPLGALMLGRLADKTGRKRITLVSLIGFGVATLAIGALPGYHQIGITAIVVLVLLRFVDGIFLGGQYTAAAPLALEHAPPGKRGLYGAIIMTGFPAAYCSIALITLGLLQVMPAGSLDSAYVQWGWRIPFAVGGLLALGWAWWYWRNVPESPTWQRQASKEPLRELFRGPSLRGLLQVFALMSGLWLAFNMVGAVLPGLLRNEVGLRDTSVTLILVLAYAALVVSYLVAGVLSQAIGRRRFFLIQGILTALLAPFLFWLIVAGSGSAATVAMMTIALVLVVVSTYAVVTTYIIERFHTGVRSTAYGVGYTTAVILPAFYAFYQEGLGTFMAYELTPMVFLALGGALIVLGAYLGPETRDVDLGASAPATGRQAEPRLEVPRQAGVPGPLPAAGPTGTV